MHVILRKLRFVPEFSLIFSLLPCYREKSKSHL